MRGRSLACCAVLLICGTAHVHAQSLRAQCATVASPQWVPFCEQLADAAVTLPPRFAIAAAGGNPVSGTASTLGMRMPGSPRWSVALRASFAPVSLPPIGDVAPEPVAWSVAADASAGLFNGFSLLPTIGGFGSVDALASIGTVSLPEDDGFDRSSPVTWSLGARVGVLRESFTAPGISLSAMYRSLPDVEYGDEVDGPYFENSEQSAVVLRGTIGKRILGIGLTGGVGHDRYRSDVRTLYVEPGIGIGRPVLIQEEGITSSRTSFFGNVSYTLLILNMSAELGWQGNGERANGAHRDTGKGGLFGGVAVRLAI